MKSLPGTDHRRRIYLLRHGHVSYYGDDGRRVADPRAVQLTDRGRSQAAAMRELLTEAPIDRVVCSGLPRTVETARIVAEPHHLPIEERGELEEIRPADLRHMLPEDLLQEHIFNAPNPIDPAARYLGGERFSECEARAVAGVEALLADPDWHSMLLVLHGVVNRLLLGWVLGIGRSAFLAFEQDPCCLNIFDVDMVDGAVAGRTLRTLNLTPYNLPKTAQHLTATEELIADIRNSSRG